MAISRFQPGITVDEHRFEFRQPGFGHDGQRPVAQMAVVALVEDEHGLGPPGLALDGLCCVAANERAASR